MFRKNTTSQGTDDAVKANICMPPLDITVCVEDYSGLTHVINKQSGIFRQFVGRE